MITIINIFDGAPVGLATERIEFVIFPSQARLGDTDLFRQ